MSSIVLMKAFERAPAKYDFGMRLITLGRIDQLHRNISASVPFYSKTLDAGCGTGKLLPLLAGRRARVTAIDKSPEMVELAAQRSVAGGANAFVTISRRTVMEFDSLYENGEFEVVILSLVMSELTPDEQRWVLKESHRILKPGGLLLLADEFAPSSTLKKLAFLALRFPLHLAANLYTQIRALYTCNVWWRIYYVAVELPLMLISFLVSEPMTRPLTKIDGLLPVGLEIHEQIDFGVAGSLRLLKIVRLVEEPNVRFV
jgi:ubiquinone/menaquinone biosynthesis C-methylase UbiE